MQCTPIFQLLLALAHYGEGIGDAVVFELFLLLTHTFIINSNKSHWFTNLGFGDVCTFGDVWSFVGLLSGVSRHMYSVSPGNTTERLFEN